MLTAYQNYGFNLLIFVLLMMCFRFSCYASMPPTKKTRLNKRYSGISSYSPEKDVGNSSKSRQRAVVSVSPDKDGGNKTSQRVIPSLLLYFFPH